MSFEQGILMLFVHALKDFFVENTLFWVGGMEANKLEVMIVVQTRDSGGLNWRFYKIVEKCAETGSFQKVKPMIGRKK